MVTVAELIKSRQGDNNIALYNDDKTWTHQQMIELYCQRAAYILDERQEGPFHIGILLENISEYPMWLGACGISGAVLIALNPTRKGKDLERDICHTNCQFLISEEKFRDDLQELNLEVSLDRILFVGSNYYQQILEPYYGSDFPIVNIQGEDTFCMMFTSGTTGAPKACICSQGRYGAAGSRVALSNNLNLNDITYVAMPLYHGNSVIIGYLPTLVTGGSMVLRQKFSASAFLPDIRKFGATFFNYVGKPLAYILATPELKTDSTNTLKRVAGNEAAELDLKNFAKRFNCITNDNYGSSEGCVAVMRTKEMPAGSLGRGVTDSIKVLDSETEKEKPCAVFDDDGRLLNVDEAIGELVNTDGSKLFEGYWNNDEANANRIKNGIYWSGDLAYRDSDGFLYFAGRDDEWMRVDGENIAAAQVEAVLFRHPDVVLAAVYAVPDPIVGDQVMAAIQLRPGVEFSGANFVEFIQTQRDFGSKWMPTLVRVSDNLPVTHTVKVLKRVLRGERWQCEEPVWQWHAGNYKIMNETDKKDLISLFRKRGRAGVLDLI